MRTPRSPRDSADPGVRFGLGGDGWYAGVVHRLMLVTCVVLAGACPAPGGGDAGTSDAGSADAGSADAGSADAGTPPVCENLNQPSLTPDPAFRVIVGVAGGAPLQFPDPAVPWLVEYQFLVPALPCSPTWNYQSQVFYVWGDLTFDAYGANGAYRLSDYVFNQIVPQVSVGWTFIGHEDAGFVPTGSYLRAWTLQALYYWQRGQSESYGQGGALLEVQPGDLLLTRIRYEPDAGVIFASIGSDAGTSAIAIERPFPNENPPLFANWRAFFEQAKSRSGSLLARPMLNVETHLLDEQTACSVVPFEIRGVVSPGIASRAALSSWEEGGLSCSRQLSQLDF